MSSHRPPSSTFLLTFRQSAIASRSINLRSNGKRGQDENHFKNDHSESCDDLHRYIVGLLRCQANVLYSSWFWCGQSLKLGTGSDSTGQNRGLLDPYAIYKSDSTGAVEVEMRPVQLSSPPITYPGLALKAGIEGSVWVKVLVGIDGVVRAALIEKDSGTLVGFEDSALACAKATKWKPAENRGRPVPLWVTYEIKFQLNKSH